MRLTSMLGLVATLLGCGGSQPNAPAPPAESEVPEQPSAPVVAEAEESGPTVVGADICTIAKLKTLDSYQRVVLRTFLMNAYGAGIDDGVREVRTFAQVDATRRGAVRAIVTGAASDEASLSALRSTGNSPFCSECPGWQRQGPWFAEGHWNAQYPAGVEDRCDALLEARPEAVFVLAARDDNSPFEIIVLASEQGLTLEFVHHPDATIYALPGVMRRLNRRARQDATNPAVWHIDWEQVRSYVERKERARVASLTVKPTRAEDVSVTAVPLRTVQTVYSEWFLWGLDTGDIDTARAQQLLLMRRAYDAGHIVGHIIIDHLFDNRDYAQARQLMERWILNPADVAKYRPPNVNHPAREALEFWLRESVARTQPERLPALLHAHGVASSPSEAEVMSEALLGALERHDRYVEPLVEVARHTPTGSPPLTPFRYAGPLRSFWRSIRVARRSSNAPRRAPRVILELLDPPHPRTVYLEWEGRRLTLPVYNRYSGEAIMYATFGRNGSRGALRFAATLTDGPGPAEVEVRAVEIDRLSLTHAELQSAVDSNATP